MTVKEPEPGDPSLADFTLAVIKHRVSISHNSHQVYNSTVIRAMRATIVTPQQSSWTKRRIVPVPLVSGAGVRLVWAYTAV